MRRRSIPDTLVEITNKEYTSLTKPLSIVDCNSVRKRNISEIVEKLKTGQLKHKPEISIEIVSKLRAAVIASPLVENGVKELLIEK